MKKDKLYMFLILQLLLVVTNLFNLNTSLFDFELLYILKMFIILYSTISILFLSKISKTTKTLFVSLLLGISLLLIFDNDSVYKIINSFYFINTYSFIICYYQESSIKRFNFINLATLVLLATEIYLLVTGKESFTYELIVNILLPLSLFYFQTDKVKSTLVVVLSLLVSYFNEMYLINYNLIALLLIILVYSLIKKEKPFLPLLLLLVTVSLSIYCKIFEITSIYNSFYLFDLDFSLYSILSVLPLLVLLVLVLYNITRNKSIPLNVIINIYLLMVLLSFSLLSMKNIENEVIILLYSYAFVVIISYISNINKNLEDNVTILALHTGFGGIEQYISSLTKMINKKVKIISTYKLYKETPFNYNAKIDYLLDYGPNKKELKASIKKKNPFLIIKNGLISLKTLYLKKYENIESIENINSKYIITTRAFHNKLVGFYSRSDITTIATEHNYHNNNKKYIKEVVNSLNNINYFVLVSKYLEEFYKDKVKSNTLYIPNVIEELPKKKSSEKSHSLVSIGRLSKEKAQEDLIELVYMLKKDYEDISLTLIGDGEERENLERLVKEKGLKKNVTFTGFLKKEKIEKYLLKSNIFVTPSKTESFGLVAIEACSYKLPVVAFDSALGIKEILENNNGILIKNRNLKEMKNKIEKLFEDRDYRDKIAGNGYQNVKKYLITNVAKEWEKLIK